VYILQWKNPALDGKTAIQVNVASTVSNQASLTFTGKGAANYGQIQQENIMRLLENFADDTAPNYATIGQTWYDSAEKILKVCTSKSPLVWKPLYSVSITDVGDPPPSSPVLGDLWFQRTGSFSGILYVFTGLGRFPATPTSNGGWSQVWPQPAEVALREEYDEMAALIGQLLGDAGGTNTGYKALGRLFTEVTEFSVLDSDLNTKYTLGTPDENVTFISPPDLKAQPFSHDWDHLLSAARWAVSRLDLPSGAYEDISSIPFVQDGRQAPLSLLTDFPASDPRSPAVERQTSRRYGSVTMHQLFSETYNVLQFANNNKFTLAGIAGNSSTNINLQPDVVINSHAQRSGAWTGGTGTVNTTFRWASDEDRNIFINGGNAIEVVLSYTPGGTPTPADAAFQAFILQFKTIRVNADKTRFFGASLPLTLADAPTNEGLRRFIITPGPSTLASRTLGGVTVTISGSAGAQVFSLSLNITTPAGLTGTTTVDINVLRDRTVFGPLNTDLFPAPLTYVAGTDSIGTTPALANVPVTIFPGADFSVSATTGPVSTTFTFTYTGSGGPTLIEWDLLGNGTWTNTGPTVNFTYPAPGVYSPRVRATNAGGQDVLTRVGLIKITP
jgi:hypothetical protein